MMKFLLQFRVHIIEEHRPKDENFDPVYEINETYELEDPRALGPLINQRYEYWLDQKGFTVYKTGIHIDAAQPLNNVENRMFIPWSMVAYFDARYELIPEPNKHPLESLVPADIPVTETETGSVN
jgi:hypothetical protein